MEEEFSRTKALLGDLNFQKLAKIGYKVTFKKLNYQVSKIDILTMKQEIKVASWLINTIDYLYNIDDVNKAIAIIRIYYYLTLIDFARVEFVQINSNDGRTFITEYMLNDINDYFDKISINLNIFSDDELTKELKHEK